MEKNNTKNLKHNNKILISLNLKQQEKTCNCRNEKYPLDNNCFASNLIYRSTKNITKFYVTSTNTIFKNRYSTVVITQVLTKKTKYIVLNYQITYGTKRRKQRL